MVPCPHRRHGGAGGPAAWQREPLHLDSAEPGTVRALMTPAIPRGRVGREAGWGVPRPHRPARWKCFHSPGALSGVFPPRKSSLRTSGEDVCLSDRLMYPGAQNGLREPLCCECHVHFGGRLPVPRAEAALPYWVPSSLRPREQSQRTVRFHVPKASESCPCLCHCVRGRLPVPRSQAMMPYWVPQVLRSPKKTVKRQRSFRGLQERPLDSRAHYNCWRVCCDRRLLLKWQQLQAVGQDEPPAPGRTASSLDSLLTLLQTVLRAIGAIRTRLWLSSKIALLSEEDQC
ncbi:uncharacterized protein C16orf95 homolog isoform X15 [Oryctolagus cuniculus]|uniref:uncharacterized protein C16orf95 homolog isoform X15 n=1 Tax=Oryctolagus cuniculus TaxID=9986 RepID=UPI00387A0745